MTKNDKMRKSTIASRPPRIQTVLLFVCSLCRDVALYRSLLREQNTDTPHTHFFILNTTCNHSGTLFGAYIEPFFEGLMKNHPHKDLNGTCLVL